MTNDSLGLNAKKKIKNLIVVFENFIFFLTLDYFGENLFEDFVSPNIYCKNDNPIIPVQKKVIPSSFQKLFF